MTEKANKEPRSWFVTIIASIFAIPALFIAMISFRLSVLDALVSFAFFTFAFLCVIVAINGKKKTLRDSIDSIWHLPS